MGECLLPHGYEDIDYDKQLEGDVIATKSLGAVWVQSNKVIYASEGLEQDHQYFEDEHEECAAIVLGCISPCLRHTDASALPGAVLVRIGSLIHEVSEYTELQNDQYTEPQKYQYTELHPSEPT